MRDRKMSPRPLLFAGLVVAATFVTACSRPEPGSTASNAGTTVFDGARLLVGNGNVYESATIVVADGHVVAAGPADDVQAPEGAAHVDLTGRTVMPAIVDAHTHLSRTREALVRDLERRAYYGVGAAISLGQDAGDLPYEVRAETIPNAARFYTAGRGITSPEPGRTDIPYWITAEPEARQAVRELAENEVDLVKIWVDDRDGQYTKLSPELYSAIIDEAHQHGLRVIAHIFALEDAKGLLRAGIDAFAHSVRDRDVDDEFIAMMQDRPNVVFVPNLPDRGVATNLGWLAGSMPDEELARLQSQAVDRPEVRDAFGIQARNLARLSAAGVTIAMGTDGNTPWGPHLEMADMVAAGMSPAQVVVAATRNSAALVGIADMGTLEAGRSADFVVLDANPLDDITNTRRIEVVYLRGTAVDRAALGAAFVTPATQ